MMSTEWCCRILRGRLLHPATLAQGLDRIMLGQSTLVIIDYRILIHCIFIAVETRNCRSRKYCYYVLSCQDGVSRFHVPLWRLLRVASNPGSVPSPPATPSVSEPRAEFGYKRRLEKF
ncbi:hypothetical protein GMOD_00009927 [Pyrenophora seminiperda CCB06]|uniref:Uncharacterized protein n=1 Tax=Pyrenophora seminiperda CCB06 TaxID=1302712 RepID=A0A3M7M1J6_9PLEO|nr:hypothetical protein GMOD_00009927 [Pyrenophora seminiperda CCB06]